MKLYGQVCKLMGSAFELKVAEASEARANELLQAGVAEIQSIENLLSEFLPASFTALVNNNAGIAPVVTDKEFCDLLQRCAQISKLTNGFFDITVSPLKKIYRFKNEVFEMPAQQLIADTLQKTGYAKVQVNAPDVYLSEAGMRISFAAIGKGYAADCVKKLWLQENVQAGYINASGDLTAFGLQPGGSPWRIGIANPDRRGEVLFYVPLYNASVATSGDYEQHFLHNGIRYSHNINPKTGLPVRGIKSVTVFSPSAELSDALATAVYTMGSRAGIDFVNQLPDTHAIIVDEQNTVHFSRNLKYEAVA